MLAPEPPIYLQIVLTLSSVQVGAVPAPSATPPPPQQFVRIEWSQLAVPYKATASEPYATYVATPKTLFSFNTRPGAHFTIMPAAAALEVYTNGSRSAAVVEIVPYDDVCPHAARNYATVHALLSVVALHGVAQTFVPDCSILQ